MARLAALAALSMTAGGLLAQPTIAIAFNPTNVEVGQTSALTFTINNPSGSPITAVAFTDTFPANLFVQNPNDILGSCGAGVITAAAGGNSVTLAGGTIPANGSCTFSVDTMVLHQATNTATGYTNTTGTVSANSGTGNTGTATLTASSGTFVIAKGFSPNRINTGSNSTLIFTLSSAQAVFPNQVKDLEFADTLPAGVVVATPNGLSSGTCGATNAGLVLTAVAGSSTISMGDQPNNPGSRDGTGANLTVDGTAGDTCSFSVNVTGATAGTKNNVTTSGNGGLTLIDGNSGLAGTATLTVVSPTLPPTISKAFGSPTIAPNGTTTLTFTITNPNASPTLTGVGFTDTLPAGLTVPNASTTPCGGTLTVAGNVITLAGASVASGVACTFNVTVTGATLGTKVNVTSAVTSVEGGTGGTAAATVNVVSPPVISQAFGVPTIFPGGTTSLTFTITDPAGDPTLTGVGFTETLPAGLTVPDATTAQCGGTLTVASNVITLAGATVAVGVPCTFSLAVTATPPVGIRNVATNNVTSTNGGTGNIATATLNVLLPGTPAPSSFLLLGTALLALAGWSGWRALSRRRA
jgi:uncharacterized repeat protein (TIGR01451 family)